MKGTDYELLITDLYRLLSPDAMVKHNDWIYGHNSKIKRKIDVSIRAKVADIPLLIIIDAKDHEDPISVADVSNLLVQMNDVKADKAVIISASGFTKSALNLARSLNIEALTVHSAKNKRWETIIQIPAIRRDYFFDHKPQFEIRTPPFLKGSGYIELNFTRFSFDGGKTTLNHSALFNHFFPLTANNKQLISGRELVIDFAEKNAIVEVNGHWVPIIKGNIKLRCRGKKTYYRYYKPSEYIAVKNHLEGGISIKSTYAEIQPIINESEWTRLNINEELPVFGNVEILHYDYFIFSESSHWMSLVFKKKEVKS